MRDYTDTFETLLRLRNYMNDAQLERYGEYLIKRNPHQPFTAEEIFQLETVRRTAMKAEYTAARSLQSEILAWHHKASERQQPRSQHN